MGIIRRLSRKKGSKRRREGWQDSGESRVLVLFAQPLDVYQDDGNKDAEQKFWERMRQMNMPRLV
ncbi:MAG TPA: hypothetical protein VLB73_03515 [Patescibacteria group bacterium]|nr:hypothetical protein [Patescibacteria group bacterium]